MPIEIKNMSFGFDTLNELLFQNIDLTIDTTWKLGLVGRNGRGKSTLLNLMMDRYVYRGDIVSTEAFVYFPQQLNNKTIFAYDAINEVMPVELWKLERECQLLQLDKTILWQPFEQLSGGEQTKVLLAALFCEENCFPLIDEPTNHLDAQSRQIVARYLKKKKGLIVVSHDRLFLDEIVDHILAIEKEQLAIYKGNFSTYTMQKEKQDSFELAQNKKIKTEVERLHQTAKEKANWATKKEQESNDSFSRAQAARMMKRSKAIQNRMQAQIEQKSNLLHNIESVNALTINCASSHRNPLLRVRNFTMQLNGKRLFEPISFELYQREQLALIGPNGSGKTSFLRYLLTGEFDGNIEGEMTIPKGLTMSTIRQLHDKNNGLLESFASSNQLDYTLFLNNLRILGMERDVFKVPIEQMSNGQQKKVEFAKSLGTSAELYVWDEPLNYLDVFNHTQIETMIQTYKPTLLFVEHDEAFVQSIATKTIHIIPC